MARDYSKYSIEGIDGKYNKRKVVLTVVEDYINKNTPTYEELINVFPDDLQGSSKGMIRNVSTDSYDANRFFSNNQITTEGYTCVVSNQWGTDNLARFIEHAATLGYNILKVDSDSTKQSGSYSEGLSVKFQVRRDDQTPICTVESFSINPGSNSDLMVRYNEFLEHGDLTTFSDFVSSMVMEYEKEFYYQAMTNSANENEYCTIQDMQSDSFDWFEVCPHIVVFRIGDIDVSAVVKLDDENEEMVKKAGEILKCDDLEWIEDAISDYFVDARFSVDQDTFIEVMEENDGLEVNQAAGKNDVYPTMTIPSGLFEHYQPKWGRYVVFHMENSPSMDIERFKISLDLQDRVVLGTADEEDDYRRWFQAWEVLLYEGYISEKSYDGVLSVTAYDYIEDVFSWNDESLRWKILCHTNFEDLDEGKLPDGVNGDALHETIAKPSDLFEIYDYIRMNRSSK
jgi:hypothetical protein